LGQAPAIGHPGLGVAPIAGQPAQQHLLVVAHQVDHRRQAGCCTGAQVLDHPGTVRTAVDVVAEMHQQRRVDRLPGQVGGDPGMQFVQLLQAAMDIAHSINPLSGRQNAGCWRVGNHGRAA
jgi:hypothetical protein